MGNLLCSPKDIDRTESWEPHYYMDHQSFSSHVPSFRETTAAIDNATDDESRAQTHDGRNVTAQTNQQQQQQQQQQNNNEPDIAGSWGLRHVQLVTLPAVDEPDIVRRRNRSYARDPLYYAPFHGPRFEYLLDLTDSGSLTNMFNNYINENKNRKEAFDAKARQETKQKLYGCWNEDAIDIELAEKPECAICFEPIHTVNGSYKRLACNHSDRFHFECIEKHFEMCMKCNKRGKCPLCRSYLRSDSDIIQEKVDVNVEHGITF